MRWKWLWLLAVAGCGQKEEAPADAVDAETPVPGGTAIVVFESEPDHLIPYGPPDVASSEAMGFLFRMLAETDANYLDYSPSVASSWEYNEDRTILTMHLRHDVLWSDGVPLTAADVVFTHEIASDEQVGWGARHWKENIERVEAVDTHTVRFHLKQAFRESFRYCKESFLVPKHLLQEAPRDQWASLDFARNPVGCGPFKFESWEPGQRIILARNEHYFVEGQPYLDRIVIEFNADPTVRLQKLRAGLVDIVSDLDPAEADRIRQQEGNTRILTARGRLYNHIAYNLNEPLFQQLEVRKALTMAIDRKAIVDGLCFGFAELFEGPLVPSFWGYDPSLSLTSYDPEAARQLLAAAGWVDTDGDGVREKDGKDFAFTMLVPTNVSLRRAASVPIQRDWSRVGVKVDIAFLESAAIRDRRGARDYQAYYGGWSTNISGNFEPIWGCDQRGKRLNYIDYCNPEVDRLNDQALEVKVPQQAIPYYHELQRIVRDDHPYTWLYYLHNIVGVNRRLQNVQVDNRSNYLNMEEWWIPEQWQ